MSSSGFFNPFGSSCGENISDFILIQKSITENGNYIATQDNADGYSRVYVNIPDRKSIVESDVTFYDYDGTIVKSYTADDFANIDALPENPSHEGLTAQGWNWSLEDAKTYVATYGKLNIGQMYITDDGKTRIYITLREGRLQPQLGLGINGSVDVDWGDGTAHDTMTGSDLSTTVYQTHTYATEGEYVITLTVTGSVQFNGSSSSASNLLTKQSGDSGENRVYANSINRIEIGGGVTSIDTYAFSYCSSLSNITIPQGVTSIGIAAFQSCYPLSSITIPSSVTSIGIAAFNTCPSLSNITIPSSVTSISDNAFYYCSSLSSITIPSSVTSIGGSAFQHCYSLSNIIIPSSVTSISDNAFQYCYSLSSITIPQGVTSIGNFVLYYCYSLSSITIPQGVTSIGNGAFQYCYPLSSITIPSSVTSIGNSTFRYCSGLGKLIFENSTPATAGSNAFSNLPTDCIIYVPQGSLSAYTSKSNYPSSSTYTYIEY